LVFSCACRDVKPENILVIKFPSAITAKLADFGAARIAPAATAPEPAITSQPGSSAPSRHDSIFQRDSAVTGCLTDYTGSRWYRAPELLGNSSTYTCMVDNWALGCSLAEFATEKPLFPGETEQEILDLVFQHYYNVPSDVIVHLLRFGMKINHCHYFSNGTPKNMMQGDVAKGLTEEEKKEKKAPPCKSIHAILYMLRLPVRSVIVKMLSLVPEEREPCFNLLMEINNA
jgi:serine/threonine protein kinase